MTKRASTVAPFAHSELGAGLDMTPQRLVEVQKYAREPDLAAHPAGRGRRQRVRRPTARKMMPRKNSVWDPSIKMPARPKRYGGVHTTAPGAPPTAAAVNLSRRERVVVTPMSRAGTAT
jgi:hypothetical protein